MRFVCKVCVIILLASFFLMSHNASAVTTTLNMNEYDVINQEGNLSVNCEFYQTSQNVTNVKECSGWPVTNGGLAFLRKMESVEQFAVKEGDIVEFDVNVFTPFPTNDSNFLPGWVTHLYFLGGSADFTAMEYRQTVDNSFVQGDAATSFPYVAYQSTYHVIYRARRDAAVRIGLTSSQHWFEWYGMQNAKLTFAIYNVMHYRYAGTNVNKEQAEATQNAADESESEAQDNSSSTQTSNLIGVLSQFTTALTALQPTNCNVTLAWPSALGGNMQVNLCQNKNYAGNIISVFGSLTLIVFYIPFSLKILSMIYNEIRSFTNG